MENFFERVIVEPMERFFDILIQFLPNIFSAILILIIGFIVARTARLVLAKILRWLKADEFAGRTGMDKVLSRSGIKGNASDVIGRFIGWIVMVGFVMIALSSMNMLAIDSLFERFFLYLPNVFVAVFILIFGVLIGNFAGRAALIAAVNAGLKTSGLIGKFAKFTVYIFAISIALEQLAIGKETVVIAFSLLMGGVVLAFAIAFGLGGRDLAKEYLEKKIKEDEEGDDIQHL